MRMHFLLGDLEPIALEIQVVDVGEPNPCGHAPRRFAHTGLLVPLDLLVEIEGLLEGRCGERGIEQVVDHDVVVTGDIARRQRMEEGVELVRRIGTPTPKDRRIELMRIDVGIPASALDHDLDADGLHLVGKFHGKSLAHRVVGSIVQVERSAHAVLRKDPVASCNPSVGGEQGLGRIDIGFDLHVIRRPRHAVPHAVSRNAVAAEHVFDHDRAIDREIDRTTQR